MQMPFFAVADICFLSSLFFWNVPNPSGITSFKLKNQNAIKKSL